MQYLTPSASSGDGRGALSLNLSDCIHFLMLTQGGAKTFPIPAGARHAIFNSTVDFMVKFGGDGLEDVAIPTGDILDGSSPEMSPSMRSFDTEDTKISIIGLEAGMMTISFYGG